MNNLCEEYEYKGHQVSIFYDDDPPDPREWDNLGTMICFHRNYNLGDQDHGYDQHTVKDIWEKRDVYHDTGFMFILPVFLYDHSGIMVSTKRDFLFRCPWDSMQVGIIKVNRREALQAFQRQRVTKKLRERIFATLAAEVETYNSYVTGSALGYVIERDGEHVDSCWGYYGDPEEHMGPEIEAIIDGRVEEQEGLIY